jgi:succinoglycan biosynthesis transport protein ExoP
MGFKERLGLDAGPVRDSTARSVSHLISMLRRHLPLVIGGCLAGIALGTLYLIIAEPLYTASAYIMMDNQQVRALHDVSTFADSPTLDASASEIESEAEVLRSERLSLAVLRKLKLPEDRAFIDPPWVSKIWASVIAKISTKTDIYIDADLRRQMTAVDTLKRNLTVSRIGHTFVLEVDYTSTNPVRAAEIVNEYINTYMLEQLNAAAEAAHRARGWLQQRTEELRRLSVDADLAAQKFKADNDLLAVKGTLVSEQQLNEETTQLVAARTETAQAEARYRRIKDIIDTHQTESAVTESLPNPVINELRTRYVDASKRLSDMERKLGPHHVVVVNLKDTMDELSALLFQELGRVAEKYRNDFEVATGREKALTRNLARQQSISVAANDAQVQLRQLEQKSESYKALYQNYLQRYQEAAQQESFPMAKGHVVSEATPPLAPSQPRKPSVLALSLVTGALAGAAAGLFRESLDRVFRTAEQVRYELEADVLGILPILPPGPSSEPTKIKAAVVDSNLAIKALAPILRYSIDHPFSIYAEALRSARVAADITFKDQTPKIVGLVSLLPGEGKTTVAKNFASLLALEGARTLLIDGDTRNPSLTRELGCENTKSTQLESSLSPQLTEFLKCEAESGLQILPCTYVEDGRRAAGLSSAMLQAFLKNLNQCYEYVVIDLPPLGPSVNARGLAPVIDGFIFVVAWGETSRAAVSAVLAKEYSIREKLLGVIINKVDMDKLADYEHFGSDGYYYQQYKKYYKDST